VELPEKWKFFRNFSQKFKFMKAGKSSAFILFLLFLISGFWIVRQKSKAILQTVSFSQEIFDRNGERLRMTLSGDEKYRLWTPLESIHPSYIEATLLKEDRYFYYHFGINPISLMKSIWQYSTRKDIPPGASTITMQLARLRYGLKTRTFIGKLQQITKSLEIELFHSKKEILEAYLNLIPFGGPIEGIGAASAILFNKTPSQLSISDSLLLTIIPQNPSHRRLDNHQGVALSAEMSAAFYKLQKKWSETHPKDRIRLQDVVLKTVSTGLKDLPFHAPHFTQFVLSQSPQEKIKTTLDLKQQQVFENITRRYLYSKKHLGVHNAAVLLTNSQTGEILTYIGSGDFFSKDIQGQNDGVLAKRSPGSTLKPFVYSLAFQQGLIHPHTILKDLPLQFANYEPENFDNKYLGPISAADALRLSRNIPAIDLSNQLKSPTLYEFLNSADIFFPRPASYYGLSIVLGGTEVSPWQLSELYSTLARHGKWQPNIWNQEDSHSSFRQLLSPESSFFSLDILSHTHKPYETYDKSWTLTHQPVAWKTGTSHGYRDAWTAGLMGPYTLVVWVGNFDNSSNSAFIGKDIAAPLFFQIADLLRSKEREVPQWLSPVGLNIKKVDMCSVSGDLPGTHCVHKQPTWYQPGTSPITRCTIHRPVAIDVATNTRQCGAPTENSKIEVFEFWSSDIRKLFYTAGINRKDPPAFSANCILADTQGSAPQIVSPLKNVTILKSQSASNSLNTISLSAVLDGDTAYVHWYLNNNYLKKTRSEEAFMIVPPEGNNTITVMDQFGRSDSRELRVQTIQ
jgi:penicillin-binding protein 1C